MDLGTRSLGHFSHWFWFSTTEAVDEDFSALELTEADEDILFNSHGGEAAFLAAIADLGLVAGELDPDEAGPMMFEWAEDRRARLIADLEREELRSSWSSPASVLADALVTATAALRGSWFVVVRSSLPGDRSGATRRRRSNARGKPREPDPDLARGEGRHS